MPETVGELNVATSLLTELPVRLRPPGMALLIQLLVLSQVASTGALVHVWPAAKIVFALKERSRSVVEVTAVREEFLNIVGIGECGLFMIRGFEWFVRTVLKED